jgi:hypothetical protein
MPGEPQGTLLPLSGQKFAHNYVPVPYETARSNGNSAR